MARLGIDATHIVLEITEQHAFPDDSFAFRTIERLRGLGIRYAFDDVGVAYSHLPFIGKVRPSYLKISQEFGTGFEDDDTRSKLVRSIVSLARDFGCAGLPARL